MGWDGGFYLDNEWHKACIDLSDRQSGRDRVHGVVRYFS